MQSPSRVILTSAKITTQYLEKAFADWDPEKRPVHCANCRHAVVGEETSSGGMPLVRCEKRHGSPPTRRIRLYRLIVATHPICFADAKRCPDFKSMS